MSRSLSRYPIHLGLGATAVGEPEFTGIEWYEQYMQRHAGDGHEGRLVSMFTFADVAGPATAVFITAGAGTQARPRSAPRATGPA